MASASYIRKKRERASKRGIYGNEVKRKLMMERGEGMQVVGSMRTDGLFGEHLIELIAAGDERLLWIRVDGAIRRPRSCAGVARVVRDWIWKQVEQ